MRTKARIATTSIAAIIVCFVTMIIIVDGAGAHAISKTKCAQVAHSTMVRTPPHTVRQRRVAFRQCLAFAAGHAVGHRLAECDRLRLGKRSQWHIIRNACRVMVIWPFNYSDREAVTVAWCEGSLHPDANNGIYLGTFQMGDGERARWGHGATVATQTAAAAAYYEYDRDVLGRGGWGPWSCAPGTFANRDAWRRAPAALVRYVYG